MKKDQEQRLFFYSKNPEDLEKTLGKKKHLNPYSLIPEQLDQEATSAVSSGPKGSGKFTYDVLLGPKAQVKGKQIVKQDRRVNYRTKMCPYGRDCRRRLSCTFAHNEQQLRKPFKHRKEPCKLYQLGKCQLGAACRDYHGNMDLKKKNYKYKTQICKAFLQGNCPLGRVCINIHEMPEEIEEEEQNSSEIQEIMPTVEDNKQREPQEAEPKYQEKGEASVKKKVVVEVKQQKIGTEQLIEDGLSFTFNF